MEPVDIILLVIIAVPALVGAAYGFLNIVFSLMAWAVAAGIAIKYMPVVEPMLVDVVDSVGVRTGLAFVALFLVSLLVFSMLSYFIVKLLGRAGLTAADRILGLLFGTALGAMIVTMAVFLGGFTEFPQEPWWQESKMIKPFQTLCILSHEYLPENVLKYHGY